MTGRLLIVVVAGLALVCASLGAASYALGRAPRALDIQSTPSGNVITAVRWRTLQGALARAGFDPTTARVVTAAPPLALVTATRKNGKGDPCLILTRSGTMGSTVCGNATSLVTFTSPGHFDQRLDGGATRRIGTTNMVGIVPSGVVSLQQEWSTDGRRDKSYTALLSAPRAMVFGETIASAGPIILTARTSAGRVVARETIRASSR